MSLTAKYQIEGQSFKVINKGSLIENNLNTNKFIFLEFPTNNLDEMYDLSKITLSFDSTTPLYYKFRPFNGISQINELIFPIHKDRLLTNYHLDMTYFTNLKKIYLYPCDLFNIKHFERKADILEKINNTKTLLLPEIDIDMQTVNNVCTIKLNKTRHTVKSPYKHVESIPIDYELCINAVFKFNPNVQIIIINTDELEEIIKKYSL